MQAVINGADIMSEWSKTSGNQPIPRGWRLVRLGEVAEHCLGKMLDQRKQINGELVPYLRNPNVQWFEFDLRHLAEMRFQSHELPRYEIKNGDVIICEGGEPGRAAIWSEGDTKIKFQKALHRVRPSAALLNRFLVRRLQFDAQTGRLDWYFTGTTIKHFTGQDLHRYLFPLPPLPDQHRIAAILDKADAIRRKREEGIRLTEELLRSTFLEMFGDPVTNEQNWPMVRVKDAGEVQLGRQRAPKYQTGKHTHAYIRVANVFEDRIDLTDVLSMDFDSSDFATYRLVHGDILLNEGQSTELVGRPAMWRDELPECCFQNTLIRFRASPDKVEPEFALEVFLYYLRKGQFARQSSKTSSVAHLGASRFAEMPFPLPPLKQQKSFAEKRRQIHKLHECRHRQVQSSRQLFDSLVQRAFRGEL